MLRQKSGIVNRRNTYRHRLNHTVLFHYLASHINVLFPGAENSQTLAKNQTNNV